MRSKSTRSSHSGNRTPIEHTRSPSAHNTPEQHATPDSAVSDAPHLTADQMNLVRLKQMPVHSRAGLVRNLQRRKGNQAVQRMLSAPGTVIQRDEDELTEQIRTAHADFLNTYNAATPNIRQLADRYMNWALYRHPHNRPAPDTVEGVNQQNTQYNQRKTQRGDPYMAAMQQLEHDTNDSIETLVELYNQATDQGYNGAKSAAEHALRDIVLKLMKNDVRPGRLTASEMATALGIPLAPVAPLTGMAIGQASDLNYNAVVAISEAPGYKHSSYGNKNQILIEPEAEKEQQIRDEIIREGNTADEDVHVQTRIEMLRGKLAEAFDMLRLQQAQNPGKTILGVFSGPEWYFADDSRPLTPGQRDMVFRAMEAASASHPQLAIMPGTILWQSAPDTYKNTAAVFLNGTMRHSYDKKKWGGDTSDGQVFEGGTGNNTFSLGNLNVGMEICQDSNHAFAKQEYYAQHPDGPGLDLQILSSAGSAFEQQRVGLRQGGVAIHSDAGQSNVFQAGNLSSKEASHFDSKETAFTGSGTTQISDVIDLPGGGGVQSMETMATGRPVPPGPPDLSGINALPVDGQRDLFLDVLAYANNIMTGGLAAQSASSQERTDRLQRKATLTGLLTALNASNTDLAILRQKQYLIMKLENLTRSIDNGQVKGKADAAKLRVDLRTGTLPSDAVLDGLDTDALVEIMDEMLAYAQYHTSRGKTAPPDRLDNFRRLAERLEQYFRSQVYHGETHHLSRVQNIRYQLNQIKPGKNNAGE